jgi:uncharacterized membrane-anchored protein YhcB (DUF1043 family)
MLMSTEMVTALLALLGVLVGLLVSALIQRWTIGTQIEHDAVEREKERSHQLKRDVFVPAAEALQSIPLILSKVTNEKVDIDDLGQQFSKALHSLARVSVVASEETTEAIGTVSRIAGSLFMQGILDRIPLDKARVERDMTVKSAQSFLDEQKNISELMKQFNIGGSTDDRYFHRLVQQAEHCSANIEKYLADSKAAQDLVQEIQPELIRSLLGRSDELTEASARAVSKMRAELGLPWDEDRFVASAIESLRGAQSTAGSFLDDFKKADL